MHALLKTQDVVHQHHLYVVIRIALGGMAIYKGVSHGDRVLTDIIEAGLSGRRSRWRGNRAI